MPQPKEPASKFKLNTSYIDDYTEWTYYVNYDENKKKVWKKMKPFHVVYYRSPESEKAGHRWYYNSLPRGWDMPYSSMKSGIPNFPTEETFEGNPSYINKAKEYVEKVFDKLVKQKIVTKYLVLTDIQFRNSVKKHRKK
jgi:hypothetical protein